VRGGCGNSTGPWQFFRVSVMCVQSQAPQIWQFLAPSLLVLLTYMCEFTFCHCPLIVIALTTSKQTMFSVLHNFSYVVELWLQIIASQQSASQFLLQILTCKWGPWVQLSNNVWCCVSTMEGMYHARIGIQHFVHCSYESNSVGPRQQADIFFVLRLLSVSTSLLCRGFSCPLEKISKIDSSIFGILLCSLGHWMGCINEALRCFEI
jgi:hypothetical protein